MAVNHGMNLDKARRLWVAHGGSCRNRTRTGEDVFTHPSRPHWRVVVNARRRDAPRALTLALRRIVAGGRGA